MELAITLVLMLLVFGVWCFWKYLQNLKPYAQQIDDVFYVSNHPVTNEPIVIDSLYNVVVSVPHNEIVARAEYHRKMLRKARNQYFENPLLENGYKNREIGVYTLPFQEGKNCNENFSKEYPDRIKSFADRVRIPKHFKMKTADEHFYRTHQLKQKNTFTWDKNKSI